MSKAERSLPYQPAIDGMRAISIIAVLLFHAFALARMPNAFRGGLLGVTVFFAVSGYLITTLLLREATRTSSVSLSRFWARRARRLAPAGLAVIIASILITNQSWSGWNGFRAADALTGIWGLMNWQLIALGSEQVIRGLGPLSPYWSLAIEEQFYVLLALGAAAAARTRTPVRFLGIGLAAVWVASLAVPYAFNLSDLALEFALIPRAGELATGGLLAVAVHVRPTLWEDLGGHARWFGPASAGALVVLFATAGLSSWVLHGGYLLVAVLSCLLLVAVHSPGPTRSALSAPWLVWIGTLSYSLYLVHWPIGLLLNANTSLDRWPSVGLQLVLSFIVGYALHIAIERPIQRRAIQRPSRALWMWFAASIAASALALAVLA